MLIRDYAPEDAFAVSRLRWRAVRVLAPTAYGPAQVAAWLPEPDSVAATRACCEDGRSTWLAMVDGKVAGVTDLKADGHVDTLYVDPDHARRGVGSALLRHVQVVASLRGLNGLYTEASEIARPVFVRAGYSVDARRDLVLRGVQMHNYAMSRTLSPLTPL